jgi:hypothetical protein
LHEALDEFFRLSHDHLLSSWVVEAHHGANAHCSERASKEGMLFNDKDLVASASGRDACVGTGGTSAYYDNVVCS